ncbi:MAG: DegT/DnrJ/EryC1/StrS family aminotransferase [Tannerellaceae bacterium]|jgi:dTDP-4-amino-4,6-dideoxygalactose transaminase|nr:DegT/DnrJ/EryC1/StrS family aminotransferase [Tannerellaceae bacterium]
MKAAKPSIRMVDLVSQYHRLKEEIDEAMQAVIERGTFINGPEVADFARALASYLDIAHVVPCGNGTDALLISLMRLNLRRGDEVILPAFTYAAAAEAAILLGLTPVAVDVDSYYNIDPAAVEDAVSDRSRAIIAVHLFGQSCDMHPILATAERYNLAVIEDNAQSLGARYLFPDGRSLHTGTMGAVGAFSFFPTKMLGCFGDGGAMATRDPDLAEALRQTTVHGQSSKYHHRIIGLNSRLDTIQAALLAVKLRHIDEAIAARRAVADFYDASLAGIEGIELPRRHPSSTHVFNQYTLRIKNGRRDELRAALRSQGIPSVVYYPLAIDEQEAFGAYLRPASSTQHARSLSREVLSLPIHTEMTTEELKRITEAVVKGLKT